MVRNPRVIYVGATQIEDFLKKWRPTWSFVHQKTQTGEELPITTLQQFEQGLKDYTIDNDVDIVILLDLLFDPSGRGDFFEKSVSILSGSCLLLILQYKPDYEELIRQKASFTSTQLGISDGTYYFIPKEKPNNSIDNAIKSYINNPGNPKEIKEALLGHEIIEETLENQKDAYFTQENSGYRSFLNNKPKGKIITVTSNKGGSGKSTIALSLATYLAHASEQSVKEGLAEKPLKIVVADYNVKDGQLGFLTGAISPTMADLMKKGLTVENLNTIVQHKQNLKIDVLLAPKLPRFVDSMATHFFAEVLEMLQNEYDIVIVDTSVEYLDPLLEEVVYPMADHIVFVCDFVIHAIYGMRRWIHEVTKERKEGIANSGSGIPSEKIGIVFNKVLRTGEELDPEIIKKATANLPVLTAIPDKRSSVSKASNSQSIDLLLRDKEITLALRRLAHSIIDKNTYNLSDNLS